MKLAWLALLATTGFVLVPDDDAQPSKNDVLATATRAWLESLDDTQRPKATLAFDDPERKNWHFVPRERKGVSLVDMTEAQRALADSALRAAVKPSVYQTVRRIVALEDILREEEGDSIRDPHRYSVTLFGDPDAKKPWGFRFEGHHVSINLTLAGEKRAFTPFFLGADPAEIRSGPRKGQRALDDLMLAVVEVIDRMSPEMRKEACLGDDVRAEIELVPGVDAAGVAWNDRDFPSPPVPLVELLGSVFIVLGDAAAWPELDAVDAAARFAYAGSTEPGKPLYWRLSTAQFVVEYVNFQDGANHVHFVIRSKDDDFGARLLAEHLKSER